MLPLLELELDTLGEDWLLALQEELTKPYFLKVGPSVEAAGCVGDWIFRFSALGIERWKDA